MNDPISQQKLSTFKVFLQKCHSLSDPEDGKVAERSKLKLKETYGELGSSAVLECKVYGSPPILVSWFYDGQEITSGDKYQATLTDNTCSLKVNGLQESDMGTYSCTATNVAGSDECSKINCTTSLSASFACLEPPSFVKKPEPFNVLSGANITFTSIIKGSPPLEVKWFRGSTELAPGHKCNITLQDSVAELELFDVQPLQSGEYTCQVSNEAGKISCTTHLFVKGLCRLPFLTLLNRDNLLAFLNLFSSSYVHETVGLPVTFDCGIAGSEPIEVSWFKDNVRVKEDYNKEAEEQTIDILELLKNVDPKEYEKYARMYGITDFRGLLQAFENTLFKIVKLFSGTDVSLISVFMSNLTDLIKKSFT
uniref:Ig-like domain-containing protein n=1 Tax=Coturnix japonica TaxID=93934 RepID=A0A8C2U305_COTJA